MLRLQFRRGSLSSASLLACICLPSVGWGQAPLKFDFGSGTPAEGYTQVLPSQAYSDAAGFGFDRGSAVTSLEGNGANSLESNAITAAAPFYFSVKVPEGNYRVKVTLGNPTGDSRTTIKAESRRLMAEGVVTTSGQHREVIFVVNVRNAQVPPPPRNAPGSDHVELNNREQNENGLVLHWDDKLTLEFGDERPCVAGVELVRDDDIPTIFLAGDSTVTDQTGNTTTSWGQMLTNFLQPDIAVANHAESGETLKSFITELRFDKLLSQMKAGDYLIIQFGHNDSKTNWPQTYAEPFTTYNAYLQAYVAEARRRGATAIIVSPMERRNGAQRDSHGEYPAAAKKAAQDAGVAFIDLHAMSKVLYGALGNNVGLAFNDATHHSAYGAYELAKCVAQGIRQQSPQLARHLKPEFQGFDPAHPDPVDQFPAASGGGPGRARGAAGN